MLNGNAEACHVSMYLKASLNLHAPWGPKEDENRLFSCLSQSAQAWTSRSTRLRVSSASRAMLSMSSRQPMISLIKPMDCPTMRGASATSPFSQPFLIRSPANGGISSLSPRPSARWPKFPRSLCFSGLVPESRWSGRKWWFRIPAFFLSALHIGV